MKNKIYLVVELLGPTFINTEKTIFATHNKEKAKNWVNRYNEIIKNNENRIVYHRNNGDFCFWANRINHPLPKAIIREVEMR